MASVRPYIENLRGDIRRYVVAGPLSVQDVAHRALSSRAVVQGVFKDAGTTFSTELRRARVEIAFDAIVNDALLSATRVASLVSVSPDHLTRLVKQEYGLTTRQLLRICHLRDKITVWQKQLPPRPGSYYYHRRRERWDAAYDELLTLLEPFDARHPHRAWADGLAQTMRRPDYRQREHRAALARRRVAEAERRRGNRQEWAARARARKWNRTAETRTGR